MWIKLHYIKWLPLQIPIVSCLHAGSKVVDSPLFQLHWNVWILWIAWCIFWIYMSLVHCAFVFDFVVDICWIQKICSAVNIPDQSLLLSQSVISFIISCKKRLLQKIIYKLTCSDTPQFWKGTHICCSCCCQIYPCTFFSLFFKSQFMHSLAQICDCEVW